ncbi:hypothetical protein ACVWY5_002321 [Bradyrhizobium sp. USDA 3256]
MGLLGRLIGDPSRMRKGLLHSRFDSRQFKRSNYGDSAGLHPWFFFARNYPRSRYPARVDFRSPVTAFSAARFINEA